MKSPLRLAALAAALLVASLAPAETLFGVTVGGRLVSFDSAAPGAFATNVGLSGLTAGDTLVGLDVRPANGLLYGLAQSGRLYTINTTTGVATLGQTIANLAANGSFGVDFNPMADRLRVVDTGRNNLRANVDATGPATVDGALTYASNDPFSFETPTATAVAYTNSVAGAASTAIYYIDAALDTLATSSNPNGGILSTVGFLGFNATNLTDFEISGRTGAAFVSANVPGTATSSLYSVNLATGAGTLIGSFAGGDRISLIAAAPVPEPASVAALGIGALALLRRRRRA